jgi:hypothetical protein
MLADADGPSVPFQLFEMKRGMKCHWRLPISFSSGFNGPLFCIVQNVHSVFQNGHRTHRSGSTSTKSGTDFEHSTLATGQRGTKRQPGGKSPIRGTAPGIADSLVALPASRGTEATNARV